MSVTPLSLQVEIAELGPGENLEYGHGQTLRLPPNTVGNVTTNADFGIHALTVSCGSYGSAGGCSIDCTIGDEPFSGLPGGLFSAARKHLFIGTKVAIIGSDATLNSPDGTNGKPVPIFRGILDEATYQLDRDDLRLNFRDNAALAMETDTNARAGTSQTIYDLVSTIALQIGPPQVDTGVAQNAYVANDQNTQQKYGTLLAHTGRTYVEKRISAWSFVQKLAKYLGYVAFVRPDGLLYFGPRTDPSKQPLALVWGGLNAKGDLETLQIQHTPARNGAFQVQVASHHIDSGKPTVSTASYVNPEALSFQGLAREQIVTGETLAQLRASPGLGQIQVYNFGADGLSPAAAQFEAMGHALDIVSHEIILNGSMPGNTRLQVGLPLRISGTGIKAIDGGHFVVVGVEHAFRVNGGFVTRFRAWQDSP